MEATDFTRDDCQLNNRRISYAKLEREYRCNDCGGRIVTRWSEDLPAQAGIDWYPSCRSCGGQDFIHEREAQRQAAEASEVLEGLPPELAEVLGWQQFTPLPFEEARVLLNPPTVEI